MTELATREPVNNLVAYTEDPTGGRLVAWAQAASAANQLAKALSKTSFVPKDFQGNEYDATAAILMGDELGLSPLAALRSIFVVHGTPALYARAMVALAQSHGHEIWTEVDTPAKVVVCGRRVGSSHTERSEWTVERARKAGYTGNKKYESNPQEMLYAKAAATVARKVAADVLAGVPFSAEDLELEQPAPTTRISRKATLAPVPEPDAESPAEPTGTRRMSRAKPVEDVPLPTVDPDAQRRKMFALYGKLGLADDSQRDERIADMSQRVGRDVTSSTELTPDEWSTLLDALDEAAADMP